MPTSGKRIRLSGGCTSPALARPAAEPHANLRRGLGRSSPSRQPPHGDHPGSPAKEEVILRGQPAISATEVFQASGSSQTLSILQRHTWAFSYTWLPPLFWQAYVPCLPLPRRGVCGCADSSLTWLTWPCVRPRLRHLRRADLGLRPTSPVHLPCVCLDTRLSANGAPSKQPTVFPVCANLCPAHREEYGL